MAIAEQGVSQDRRFGAPGFLSALGFLSTLGFLSALALQGAVLAFWARFSLLVAITGEFQQESRREQNVAPRRARKCRVRARAAGRGPAGPARAGSPHSGLARNFAYDQKLRSSAVAFLRLELLSSRAPVEPAGAQTGRASASRPAKRAR